MGSWNLNKAGVANHRCAEILPHMRACGGGLFACQETQFLVQGELDRLGWRLKTSACKKAALIFDKSWADAARMFFTCFNRFVVGIFGSDKSPMVVVSAYLPDPHVDDCEEIASDVLEQISRVRDGLRARFPQASLCVLLDGNVELPPAYSLVCNGEEYEATGRNGTCTDKRWERGGDGTQQIERRTRRRRLKELLLNFMATHGLKAANTFSEKRCPTWEAWGENRFVSAKRVLDYILVPRRWEFENLDVKWCFKRGGKKQGSRLSDHAIVSARFTDPGKIIVRRPEPQPGQVRKPSLVGYRCDTWADEHLARQHVDVNLGGGAFGGRVDASEGAAVATGACELVDLDPSCLTQTILEAFEKPEVDFTTRRMGRQPEPTRPVQLTRVQEHIMELNKVKRTRELTEEEVVRMKELKKEERCVRGPYRRARVISTCPPCKRKVRHRFEYLVVDGRETEDRTEWKEELDKFVRVKLSSQDTRGQNNTMLEDIRRRAERDLQGKSLTGISLALLFRARARLKTQRATGPDRVPCELLKVLPWCTLRSIQQLFDKILRRGVDYPGSWRQLLISFMPKIPGMTNLKDGRLLCMLNAVSRWYSACIVLLVEEHVERTGVFRHIGLYGFQEHRRTHEITASLKNIGQHAATWGKGETAHLANADILQAFDHCTVCNVQRGLEHAAVTPIFSMPSWIPCARVWVQFVMTGLRWRR